MRSTVIPQEDISKVKEVIAKFDEFLENRKGIKFDPNLGDDQVQGIHSVLYLRAVNEVAETLCFIKHLLECEEEEFISKVTDKGKHTIEEVYRGVMMSALGDMLNDKLGEEN